MKFISSLLVMFSCAILTSSVWGYEIGFSASGFTTNGIPVGDYVNNIPKGWVLDPSNIPILPDKSGMVTTNALKFSFYNASKGKQSVLKMESDLFIPRKEIVCDNIVAELMLYVQPLQNKAVDTFQLIATTNDWKEVITVGEPIPIRDSSYTTGWRSFTVETMIPGVSQVEKYDSFKIGVVATAGGYSMTYGYLHSISVEFQACATPNEPYLIPFDTDVADTDISLDEIALSNKINPGVEYGRIAVAVDVVPVDKVKDIVVMGVLSRFNGTQTICISNELEKIGAYYFEKIEDVKRREPFDAGEIVSFSVFTKYKTVGGILPRGDIGKDGFAYEEMRSREDKIIGKCGSVWINELGVDGNRCYVELCGTTNRSYLSGWRIVLSGETSSGNRVSFTNNNEYAVFDFSKNMQCGFNGVVGVETYSLEGWSVEELSDVTVELINSAGVVEHSEILSRGWPANYKMVGCAKWNGASIDDWSYDWEGAAGNIFSFTNNTESMSPGIVNSEQSFLVPVSALG